VRDRYVGAQRARWRLLRHHDLLAASQVNDYCGEPYECRCWLARNGRKCAGLRNAPKG
jgi:hypothetical protein